ncbi:MAG: dehalogenase [Dehalococcoides mccartyi]|uniref:hypothetical protein n=1 Tax=Dehalococcoides mccartyi TaxID=61435 RepID=UPI0004E096BD|nr:hypothetical protein [Dehalococcoides mccartyi]AII59003.1 dehalogenase [Dehalococcoides mccartyi CG4]MCF7634737.1 dehalogenase [Dehalococcoides mccartyi]
MWLIFGLIAGGLIAWIATTLNKQGRQLTWYEWLVGLIGLVLFTFTVQNFFGSHAEGEATAANLFLLVTGLPAVIFVLVSWQLWARRAKQS